MGAGVRERPGRVAVFHVTCIAVLFRANRYMDDVERYNETLI